MKPTVPKASLFFVGVFLALSAISLFGWAAVSPIALGIVALLAAILLFIWVFFLP